jgi:hypothetical protein
MSKKSVALDMLIAAMLKLGSTHAVRENVIAFIRSCYCGRVLNYDLDGALAALARLTDDEQHGLIVWAIMNEEASQQRKLRASA